MTVLHRYRKGILLAVFILFSGLLPFNAMAETNTGFSIRARIPENQIDKNKTYFDLRMNPADVQVIEVDIMNASNSDIEVSVDAISASTNSNGIIDYRTKGIRDDTMLVPFSEIATLSDSTLQVDANSTKTISATIRMPEETYDGVVLGGIVVTKKPEAERNSMDETGEKDEGIKIQNIFSYVIGVVLRETDVEVYPEYELAHVEAGQSNHQTAIIFDIRNKEAAIAKNIDIQGEIFPKDNPEKILQEFSSTDVEMAPNSVMPLSVLWEEGRISPGTYGTNVKLTYNEETWVFENEFQVDGDEAVFLNDSNVNKARRAFPRWAIVLIIVLAILLFALVVFVVFLLKRKKNEEKTK